MTSAGYASQRLVRVATEGVVRLVTLDRPAALNALTIPMKLQLLRALRDAEHDREVRAVVVTGSGRAFCAGQDLHERLEPDAPPLEIEIRERYAPLVRQLVSMPKPVVAAVNGVAAGAGASLAFACDLRVAAEDARLVLAFGRIGLVPDSGATWLLPRLVGLGRATELAYLPDPVTAAEALRLGLVNRVVPADSVVSEAVALAARIAEGAPIALGLTKRALGRALESTLDEALAYEAALQGIAGRTADHAEGIAAFVEKRPPRFRGE
ncbi:MAG TPA: enoyl-CoA hydratase-related protein [Candidatus Dormibacteraeota bacterium]|nr:enoyl-CoA hydratase-related protein [Candidatus Dormibacteraeota bacterium]